MSSKTRSEVAEWIDRDFAKEIPAIIAENYAPRLRRKPSVWATEQRIIAAGTSPLTHGTDIRYDHAIMPHCVEPMDAADDPTIRKIVLWWPIRDGKTLGVCSNIIGRTVTDAPANIYSVHPTEDNADAFSNGDIEPMIEACLKDCFVEKKSRDVGRTIEFKKFKGGWLRIFSANALTKFHGTSVGVLLLHELDKLNPEAIWKAFGRTTGFSDAIIVMESTGTLAAEITPEGKKIYRSNIEEAYDQGDKRKWFCACRKCGYLQTLKYEQIKYPPGSPQSARYHCEACGWQHYAAAWRKLAASGKWYPTAGLSEAEEKDIARNYHNARAIDPSVRSYWRNGFNSLLPHSKGYKSKLHQFVAEGESAMNGGKEQKMTWLNEVKAELWNPESEGEAPPAWKPIFERRESYGLIVPQGGLFLTAFVDVQKYRLETGWRAWGRNEESWGMDHKVIDGYVGDKSTWDELIKELSRKWEHAWGAEMKLGFALIDGGKWPDQVYAFFQRLGKTHPHLAWAKVRASKGFGQHGHPIVTRKPMTVGKVLKGHHIGTWEAKDRIYERLRMEKRKPDDLGITIVDKFDEHGKGVINRTCEGVMHYNERFSEEFFQQLTVEQVTVTFEKGQEIRKYINPKNMRNEALDIEVGNLAAFRLHPRNLDMLYDQLREESSMKTAPAKTEETPQQSFKSPFTGRGWTV